MQGEAGLSAAAVSETDIEQKLSCDAEFFRSAIPGFDFTSLYVENYGEAALDRALALPEYASVRTLVSPYDGGSRIIGYQDEQTTLQKTIADGFSYSSASDFRIKSVQAAIGYNSILADMERIAYPEDDSDRWEKLSKELAANAGRYGGFEAFEGTTASECDSRIRSFLALDFHESIKDGKITLEISKKADTAWFILRTHNKAVKSVDGGSFTKIEEGAYLIEADKSSVVISLKASDERYYYDDGRTVN